MSKWSREAAKRLARSYEHHNWISSAQRSELVGLIENGLEDEAMTIISEVAEAHG